MWWQHNPMLGRLCWYPQAASVPSPIYNAELQLELHHHHFSESSLCLSLSLFELGLGSPERRTPSPQFIVEVQPHSRRPCNRGRRKRQSSVDRGKGRSDQSSPWWLVSLGTRAFKLSRVAGAEPSACPLGFISSREGFGIEGACEMDNSHFPVLLNQSRCCHSIWGGSCLPGSSQLATLCRWDMEQQGSTLQQALVWARPIFTPFLNSL